jgi:subtilase family serine protease
MTAPNSLTVVSGSIASLGAGASTTLTLAYSFPKAGSFDTEVQLNPKREVPETNYANDIALKAITVVQATVKYVITHFSVASVDPTDAVVEGRPAVATISVENAGNVAAGAFEVQWTPFTFATAVTHDVAAGLAPGQTETVELSFTYTFHGTATGTAAVVASGGSMPLASMTLETVIEPPLPNLRIARVLAPSDNFATLPSTQKVEIENDGNAAAAHFIVQWSPGTGQTLQSQQVNGLGEGAKEILTFTYVYPKPGTYEGLITLDPTKLIKELFTTEKTAKTLLVIPEGFVDLTVTSLSVEGDPPPGPAVQERPTLATIKVKNLGNIPSPSFVTELNPDSLGISGSGTHSVTEETGPLAPGGERTITFVFTYAKPGNFRAVAEVNPGHTVKESNYANNSTFTEVFVEQLPVELNFSTPIEVSSVNFSAYGGVLFPGEEATASFTVKNSGPIATGAFDVQFQSAAGAVKQTRAIPGLNPGESQVETFSVTYSKPGSYTMTAILDPNKQVDKVISGFNPIEETRVVTVEPINLNFSTGIEVRSPLYVSEEAEATVTVTNSSPAPVGPFAVQLQSQAGGFKQTQYIAGLNAFQSKVVTFKVTYYKAGNYTLTAILDPFKAVDKKTNGLNPIEETGAVTVDEKDAKIFVEASSTTVKYAFNYLWFPNLLVYEPGAKCYAARDSLTTGSLLYKVIKNEAPEVGNTEERCPELASIVEPSDGQVLSRLANIVTLKEETPLRASVTIQTYPEEFEYYDGAATSAGSATVEKNRKEYVELPSDPFENETVHGEGCKQPGGNEKPTECFSSVMSLFLEESHGPAFAPLLHADATSTATSSALRLAAAATQEGEAEPEGTIAEKQAEANRELAAHEAAERKAAEAEAKAAEAAESERAKVAEQEAIKAYQELDEEAGQGTGAAGSAVAQGTARKAR